MTYDYREAEMNRLRKAAEKYPDCAGCQNALERQDLMMPRHEGSVRCQSFSIASGGNRSHCTCDTCY